MRFWVAALALGCASVPALAQDKQETPQMGQPITLNGGWVIVPNEDDGYCTLAREYENRGFLTLVFDAQTDNTMIGVEVSDGPQIAAGQSVVLGMMMVNDSDDDHTGGRWDGIEYTVNVQSDGARVFYSRILGEELLDDLVSYELIGWHYGDDLLQAFSLDGADRAISTLRTCSVNAARS